MHNLLLQGLHLSFVLHYISNIINVIFPVESQSVDSYLSYFSLINKAFLTVISSAHRCCWRPSSNSAFGISLPIVFRGSC